MRIIKSSTFTGLFILSVYSILLAQQPGAIVGQVSDPLNSVIAGATIIVIDSSGNEKTVITDQQGKFNLSGLAPGKYTVTVQAAGFSVYQNDSVEITAGKLETLSIALTIAETVTNVDVESNEAVDQDPSNNASQTILKGKDLDDLPDDPGELQAYLQALAGPAAGPDGAQFTVDGFSNGRLPSKDSIREIRLNQNPMSAEYDRIGFGRVEILTEPGTDRFGGSATFNFNDESLNSRNPFSRNRAPSQARNFSGSFSGPIRKKKSSFHLDGRYNQDDTSSVVNATVLDSANNIVAFNRDITAPTRRFQINPRLDFAANDKNALQIRYEFTSADAQNQGVGGFSLPSRAFTSRGYEHDIRLTESIIINPRTINETRFQYIDNRNRQKGDASVPTVRVTDAFTGGGAQLGLSFLNARRWELQNYTLTSLGKDARHTTKFGIRIRGVNIQDQADADYAGSFTFAGVSDPVTGQVLYSSIEQYRQKVSGNPDSRFNPNQFSITAGHSRADVSQIDYGLFITNDWKARKDLTLSFGLRYENQTNISDGFNFAPRLAIAWQPGAGGAGNRSKTVFRGGFGIFYERFAEVNTLSALRSNGVTPLRYTVTDNPAILGQAIFTGSEVINVPTASELSTIAPLASIPIKIADNLQAPYSIQAVFSVERQLPFKTTLSATFISAKGLHTVRLRNINAPACLPLTACPVLEADIQALRPDKTLGNVYQYESSGYSNTRRLVINFNTRFNNKVTLFGNYTLGFSSSDTDGITGGGSIFNYNSAGFPAYSYDLKSEYAPSAYNPRQAIFIGGSIELPLGLRMNPNIIYNSGRRFNITSGVDSNRDSVFSERPTFAGLKTVCDKFNMTNSFCQISGIADPGATIIPRNYGTAPGNFVVNMNLSKNLRFGGAKNASNNQNEKGNQNSAGKKPYNMTLAVNVRNLFNTVNRGLPQGILTSPFFGRSISTVGFGAGGSANRRVELSMKFNW